VGEKFGVKAAGLSDAQKAMELVEAGASRIGTAEGVKVLSDVAK
jgi:deoxyribose-phosphate aldolase